MSASAPDDSERRLRPALRDGAAHAVMLGAGENYFAVFAIFLRATSLQIGALVSAPAFLGALSQLFGLWLLERFGRRRALTASGAFFQALALVPLAALALFAPPGEATVWFLIGIVTLFYMGAGIGHPAWSSLIGDLVPPEIRGRFFGRRNVLIGYALLGSLIGAGGVLGLFNRWIGAEAAGFAVIFAVATLARLASARQLLLYEDPPFERGPEHRFTFRDFLRRSPRSNFARFVFFLASMNFAVYFSAPYFSIYMLRDLQYDYLMFTANTAALTLMQFLPMQHWGRFSDAFGNKKILTVSSYAVSIVPFLWLIHDGFVYLLFVQVFSGFVWAGFNLAAANFIFDACSPPRRARCAAYLAVINGAAIFAGSLLGGAAAGLPGIPGWKNFVPIDPVSDLPFLFAISGFARIFFASFWMGRFVEVRETEAITHREFLFRISHLRPLAGATFSMIQSAARRKPRDPNPT